MPVGRMLKDEIRAVLELAATLKQRVIGQDHGLETIARRVQTARAGLDNPTKPTGVFLLCGPSGVGKTETALALAETLYGGEENVDRHQHVGVPGGPHRLDPEGRPARLRRLRRGRQADRGGAAQALQRRPAGRDREGAPRRPRAVLPGLRQGRDGGRRGAADRLPQHADPADLQCRLGPDRQAVRRPRADAGARGAGRGAAAAAAQGVPGGAPRPPRRGPLLPAERRHAGRHRPPPARPHQASAWPRARVWNSPTTTRWSS